MQTHTGMNAYPVHYVVQPPGAFTRFQLAVRFVAFLALGVVGLSFGTVFAFAYLALPVFAASRLTRRDPAAYLTEDGPRVIDGLRWFSAIAAWAGLIAEHLPANEPTETVKLEVEGAAHPTPRSALWRVVTGIPSALALMVLCWLGMFVWLWAAVSILISQRIGPHAFEYLVGLQRWSTRLLVYQASLVDDYPPFSFADVAAPSLPTAHTAS